VLGNVAGRQNNAIPLYPVRALQEGCDDDISLAAELLDSVAFLLGQVVEVGEVGGGAGFGGVGVPGRARLVDLVQLGGTVVERLLEGSGLRGFVAESSGGVVLGG
jgi:hypothetical protein